MRPFFSPSWLVVFLIITMLFGELHEQVHIQTGALMCGCYGPRDFNVWQTCSECGAWESFTWISTAVGPLFSFVMMWLGLFLMSKSSTRGRLLGFVLVMANLPLARVLTVALGGGDELVVYRTLLPTLSYEQLQLLGVGVNLAIVLPPLFAAWRFLSGTKGYKLLLFLLLLVGPLVVIYFYAFLFLNGLLEQGILAEQLVLGTPTLILLHTLLLAILLWFSWRRLLAPAGSPILAVEARG